MKNSISFFLDMPDEALLGYCLAGNELAIEVLYNRYLATAISYLLGMYNGDRHKAESMYNDTFINIINFIKKENIDKDFVYKYYLFGALKKNFNREYSKKMNSSNNPIMEDIAEYTFRFYHNEGNNEEKVMIKGEEKEGLFDWLKRTLSELQYSIMYLQLEGWGYEAIAYEHGISTDSVRGHLDRIRKKIKNNYRF